MKNAGKNGKHALATLFFLLAIMVSSFSAPTAMDCSCPSPNVTLTSHTFTSVSFSWDAIDGATAYKVWYFRTGDNYTSQEVTTDGATISFSNLPAGTYTFYFTTTCGEETSQSIILDDLLMG